MKAKFITLWLGAMAFAILFWMLDYVFPTSKDWFSWLSHTFFGISSGLGIYHVFLVDNKSTTKSIIDDPKKES